MDDGDDKDDNTNNSIDKSGWSGIYYYSVPFSSITSGWTPLAVISHLTDCLDDWSGLWLSPLAPTHPPPHTSPAAHTSWAVSNSELEQSRAPVNAAISSRIEPIPHNLVAHGTLHWIKRARGCSECSVWQQSSYIAAAQLKRVKWHGRKSRTGAVDLTVSRQAKVTARFQRLLCRDVWQQGRYFEQRVSKCFNSK